MRFTRNISSSSTRCEGRLQAQIRRHTRQATQTRCIIPSRQLETNCCSSRARIHKHTRPDLRQIRLDPYQTPEQIPRICTLMMAVIGSSQVYSLFAGPQPLHVMPTAPGADPVTGQQELRAPNQVLRRLECVVLRPKWSGSPARQATSDYP